MSIRVRVFYEKRYGACFVPHVALATLFTRSANRAGIALRATDGFSPHAKMSFGPELPAGVVALCEPVDVWINLPNEELDAGELHEQCLLWRDAWDAQMPEGFSVREVIPVPEGAGSLGKACRAAFYQAWTRLDTPEGELALSLRNCYGEALLSFCGQGEGRLSFVLGDPAQNGIGGWVRSLMAAGAVVGWQDMCIVRLSLGSWEAESFIPLAPLFQGSESPIKEEGILCLQTELPTER